MYTKMKPIAFPDPIERLERSHLDDIGRWVDLVVQQHAPSALLVLGRDVDIRSYPGLQAAVRKVGETHSGIRAYRIQIDDLLSLMSITGFSEKHIDEQSKDREPAIVHVLFIASGQCSLVGYRQVEPDDPDDGGESIPELESKVA